MPLFKWRTTSKNHISALEEKIFSCLGRKPLGQYILLDEDQNQEVWTITMDPENKNSKGIPLVMLHGMGAGVGLWLKNLEQLSSVRKVYALDLPGFGRSFRFKQSSKGSAEMAERIFVDSIESWRKSMNLEEFVLLGHSLGGYLASAYALKYSEHVKGLVLVDSWGFPHKIPKEKLPQYSLSVRTVLFLYRTLNPNPLALLRAAGPWGPALVTKFRPDLIHKFRHDTMKDDGVIADYVYHCNAREPSGETAFKCMVDGVGWAQNPMIDRIGAVSSRIPITMIHGRESWIDWSICQQVQALRPKSVVDVEIIKDAGHHVYVDQADIFNAAVNKACLRCEKNISKKPSPPMKSDDGEGLVCEAMMEHVL